MEEDFKKFLRKVISLSRMDSKYSEEVSVSTSTQLTTLQTALTDSTQNKEIIAKVSIDFSMEVTRIRIRTIADSLTRTITVSILITLIDHQNLLIH